MKVLHKVGKVICIFILILLPLIPTTPVSAEENLADLQTDKNELDHKKNELSKEIQSKQNEIVENSNEIGTILEQIQVLNAEMVKLNEKKEPLESAIFTALLDIESLNNDVVGLENNTAEREIVLRERVRALQVSGGPVTYIDVIMGSTSFSDFIDRFSAVTTLMDADKALMKQQRFDHDQLNEAKNEIEERLSEQRKSKVELQDLLNTLDALTSEKDALIDALEVEQTTLKGEKEFLDASYEETDRMSIELENAIQQEQKRIYESEMNRISSAYCQPTGEVDSQKFKSQFKYAGALTNADKLIVDIAKEQGIDPVLMGAIALHETGNGQSNAVKMYKNPGGLMNPESDWTTLLKFDSLEDGLVAMAKTMKRLILKEGKVTIKELGSAYAPLGADNDPLGLNEYWEPNVTKKAAALGGLTMNCSDQFPDFPEMNDSTFWTTPAKGRLTSQFGWRIHPKKGVRKEHRGLDIANQVGTPIVAAANGTVIRAEAHATYGNMVMLSHFLNGQVYTTVYAHMSSLSVQKGQTISKGHAIGAMGSTGDSTGSHLHFEFHEGYYSGTGPSAVNPLRYVPF